MGARLTGVLIGAVFGVALSWTGMTSPVVIRHALLLQDSYLYLMFASAVLTAFVGLRLLRAFRARAVLTGDEVSWTNPKPERRNVVGALFFGVGWALSGACPGPVATQLGQGIAWSLFTIAGIVTGILLHKRRGLVRSGRRRDAPVGAAGGRELAQQAR